MLAIGIMLAAPTPDLIVTSDGRHVAIMAGIASRCCATGQGIICAPP
ncbi:hypothetical protein P0F65_04410 [Sphingomonas sp. I4]